MYIPYKVIISHTSLLNNHLCVVEDEQTEDNKPDIDLSLKKQLWPKLTKTEQFPVRGVSPRQHPQRLDKTESRLSPYIRLRRLILSDLFFTVS